MLNVTGNFLQKAAGKVCVYPTNRAVVRVTGADKFNFLQGIFSNDVFLLTKKNILVNSIYSGFFNSTGRVVCDLILHTYLNEPDTIYVDVCPNITTNFVASLKKYRLRANVDFEIATDLTAVNVLGEETADISPDPRNRLLGTRLIVDKQTKIENDLNSYKKLRYGLRIPENSDEIPPNKAIPVFYRFVENNGVSFEKGCYLGQELTTRSMFGEVNRTLINFEKQAENDIFINDKVFEVNKTKSIGEVRGVSKSNGIVLINKNFINSTVIINDKKFQIKD